MKPFNIEEAKAGKPVVTRAGNKTRIVCFDKSGRGCPLIALVDKLTAGESVQFYGLSGRYVGSDTESPEDLFMSSPKTMVGGVIVNSPEVEHPHLGTKYYTPAVDSIYRVREYKWCGNEHDTERLRRGLVHLDRLSAISHTEAFSRTQKIKD